MKKQISFLLLSVLFCSLSFGQKSTFVRGHLINYTRDTIKCVLLLNSVTGQTQTIKIPVINGLFNQPLEVTKPTYLYITDGENYINGLIESGDNIILTFDATNNENPLSFEGKGKEKFQFLNYFLQAKIYNKLKEQIPLAKSKKFPFDHMFNYVDSAENMFLQRLLSLKKFMTKECYSLLLGDIKGSFLANRNRSVGFIYHEIAAETLKNRQNELTTKSKSILQNLSKFNNNFYYSPTYVMEVYNILFSNYDYLVVTNKATNNLLIKYHYLDSLLPKGLKIPVLTLFLKSDINKLNQSEDIEALIKKIYQSPKDSSYKNYITNKYKDATDITSFKKGTHAPNFIIENTNGEKISLSSFKGKVLYIDFWYAACGPCHVLFEAIKPAKEYFSSDTNVVFLYVSIDHKDVWKKSLKKYDIKGYHAFTENIEINHPIIQAYKVRGYPTTCLIDKNGNIFNANPSNISDELKKQIEDALKVE